MNINAQSLKFKMDELRTIVKEQKPHIIAITETWGKDSISDASFQLEGYNMYRNDRENTKYKFGGGTLLYINKKLGQRMCKPLNCKTFESSTWCWVTPKQGKKVLVGCIYRSTSSSTVNDINMLTALNLANDMAGGNRLLLMGDFNVPKVDWVSYEAKPGAKPVDRDFLDCVTDNILYQHVKVPTRFRGTESSTLDLILTQEEEDVKNIKVLQPIGMSDHGVVTAEFICEWKSRNEPKMRRAYYKGDYSAIIDKLNEVNWDEKFFEKSTQECWDIFKVIYKQLVEEYIPLITPKEYNEPWMNDKTMKLWKKKYHAWKRFNESGSNQGWDEYKKQRDKLKKKIRKAKRLFERKIAKNSGKNRRAFFKYVNSKLTVRPEITAIKGDDGQLKENDADICEAIAKYFNTVYLPQSNEEMPDMQNMTEAVISSVNITQDMVKDKLEKLNVRKSCGPDDIHPHVLQRTASAICVPLTIVFKLSLDSGECPDDWKVANVTPIYKKGDRTDPANYRPVSLTSQVCKVMESLVRAKIIQHLDENNLISEAQHGFREGRSCLTNLLETLEAWTKIIDDGDGIDVAYLDFRKAFDLVSHKHLIHKLTKYGISGQIIEWVKNFLDNRTQRVLIRGTASSYHKVTSGVPQGSVLGPILFLIFINDLPLKVLSPLSLFADDSKIFTRIIDASNADKNYTNIGSEVLQQDLNCVLKWAKKWKMEFNVDKCKIMHIGQNNPKSTYNMDGKNLEATLSEKDLGVLIDYKLDFGSHIKEIVGRANRMLGMIRVSFACLNIRMFLNLYMALVRPLLEYCVQVWSPHLRKHINLIEGVQRRATRMVPELKHLSYEERLDKLKLTTLEERRARGDMIETYKIITGKEKVNPRKFFQMVPDREGPRARDKKIFKQQVNKDVRLHSFTQRVNNGWNSLTNNMVNAEKTSEFKALLDAYMATRTLVRENDIYIWQ